MNYRRVKFPGPEGEMTGYFHGWGLVFHEGLRTTVTFAIIELKDGEIWMARPGDVKFIDTIPDAQKAQIRETLKNYESP